LIRKRAVNYLLSEL